MKNIIAAVDFSAVSANAARYAVKLAEFYKCNLWLYHAYQLPVTATEIGYPFVNAAELENRANFQMEELVKELFIIPKEPVNVSSKIDLEDFEGGLLSFCDRIKADMLVMGISGKTGLQKILPGSNTIYAIQHLPYPVLVVPPEGSFSAYWKIGLAVDYKNPVSTHVTDFVNSITTAFMASLYIINVDWKDEHHTDADREQQTLLRQHLTTNNVHFRSLLSEDVATAIHEFADEEKIELLITLPRKHNFLERLFGSSHTPGLLQQTTTPVLCILE